MRTATCPDCKAQRQVSTKGTGPILRQCWQCLRIARGKGPKMPARTITLEQAAQSFLGLLSYGYGDGLLNDWMSRGAPSDQRAVGGRTQMPVTR